MSVLRIVAAALGAALLYGVSAPARAGGSMAVDDAKRGFSTRVPDSFKQNPPKPDSPKYEAATFYDDQAKYKSSGSANPEFNITWWVTPKAATTPGAQAPADPNKPPEAPRKPTRDELEDMFGIKSQDQLLDRLIENNTRLFGSKEPPMADRWATAKAGKTTKQKIDFKYLEFNTGKPKEKSDPVWYLFVAKLTIERPLETVEVGFYGNCAREFADKLGPAFLSIVKGFETKSVSGGTGTREEMPTDPDKKREWLKKNKLVPGWKCMDSPKKQYLVFYAEDVNDKLVKDIAEQVESLRAQIYEVVFPPDRPITEISVVRVCKDRAQYTAYGTPGGSAGVWMPLQGELIFYEDTANKKDSLRVLYHEAFHQYIFYSCGAVSPPSWFNEGHGDFFYGHDFKDGKWQLGKSLERIGDAAKAKRDKRVPHLKEWLRWEQDRYYVRTPGPLTIYENYALGWDFVYFLRTSKKPEYQGILDRYFQTLKTLCTKKHDEREAQRAKMKAEGNDPGPISAAEEMIDNDSYEQEWHDKAYEAAFKGVDLEQLNKEWLATIQ
jgi:hypothetical protein